MKRKNILRMAWMLIGTAFAAVVLAPGARAAAVKKQGVYLGVSIENLSRKDKEKTGVSFGVQVTGVKKGSPAEQAGIREGDVIQVFNGEKIRTPADLRIRVGDSKPDTTVNVQLVRNKVVTEVAVKIGRIEIESADRKIRITKTEGSVWLGVKLHALGDDLAGYFKVKPDEGALILEVEKRSPAEKAGLKAGDVIVRIGKERVYKPGDVSDILQEFKPGDKADLTVVRQGREMPLLAELDKRENGRFHLFQTPFDPFHSGVVETPGKFRIETWDDAGGDREKGWEGWNEIWKDRAKELEIRSREIGEKIRPRIEDLQKRLEIELNTLEEHATI